MFYKQFLKIIDVINSDFLSDFDYWLATIPESKQDNISASLISAKFSVPYSQADIILKFSKNAGILEEYYLLQCPNEDCNLPLMKVGLRELADVLMNPVYCHSCDREHIISPSNVYTVFKRILKPDVSEEEINLEILKRVDLSDMGNFNCADSLENNKVDMYKAFFNPDESAYKELEEMFIALDEDYGNNTTAKGNAYEQLALRIVKNIKFVTGTNEIKTQSNQFDCTVKYPFTTMYPTIFNYLTPYFIIECKNEKYTPSNTYFHKLSDIMDTNEAKVGIIFSRKPASDEDRIIAHDQYLAHMNTRKQRILLSISNDDLDMIIKNRVNVLEYFDYKIIGLTTNFKNGTFEMFK